MTVLLPEELQALNRIRVLPVSAGITDLDRHWQQLNDEEKLRLVNQSIELCQNEKDYHRRDYDLVAAFSWEISQLRPCQKMLMVKLGQLPTVGQLPLGLS